jgi:coenzyme F420-0:L-glutamate ligase/coenzyme F420-1:gamma-L-glutamate ligase
VAEAAPVPAPRVEIIGVTGLPEITEGTDLATAIVTALDRARVTLHDGDIVVVSSKIISKAEGLCRPAGRRDEAIDAETVRVVAERDDGRRVTRIVEARSGPVMAAAGVDASNTGADTVLLLPPNPDAAALALRRGITAVSGAVVGVIVSDTGGRAWREGQSDFALGAAGVIALDDLRGTRDTFGRTLDVTVRAVADELAAAADLVKGKAHGIPAAVVRGQGSLVIADDGPGARCLLRPAARDWFAAGHVEAVRSSLGVPPGTPGVPVTPLVTDGVVSRLRRAVDVATAVRGPFEEPEGSRSSARARVTVEKGRDGGATAVLRPPDAPARSSPEEGTRWRPSLALGALAQRVVAAAWAEGLDAVVGATADGVRIAVRQR